MDGLSEARSPETSFSTAAADEPGIANGAEPPRAIVFDVPDVLYDATLWRRWLVQLVAHLGVRVEYRAFYRAWDAQLLDVHCGRREYAEALESLLLAYGLSWAQVDEIEAAGRIQRQRLELNVRPLPGVARALDELVGLGFSLVAWADAPLSAEMLAERLRRIVPKIRFDAVLTSLDLECAQPAAACYHAMLEAAGLPAPQVAYVGHDTAHLAAARSAAMRCVAFNFDADARADHYLTRFEELLGVAKAWSSTPRHVACAATNTASAGTR